MVKNGENGKNKNSNLRLFLGEYQPNITGGARIALPKKIRDVVGSENTIVLSRGFEKCIAGYTIEYWQKESEKALTSTLGDRKARLLKRYMFSGAFDLEFDGQGRVVMPKSLMDYANISEGDEVLLVGAGDHFEIWNKKLWEDSISLIESEIS